LHENAFNLSLDESVASPEIEFYGAKASEEIGRRVERANQDKCRLSNAVARERQRCHRRQRMFDWDQSD